MIVTITSTNPKLSWILAKNPETLQEAGKAFARPLRKGMIYGWYTNPYNNTFRLMFKDHPTEVSYGSGPRADFEYLDLTRYSSPMIPIGMVSKALAQASKTPHELDTEDYESSCMFVCKVVRSNLLEGLPRYGGGNFSLELTPLTGEYFKVRIAATSIYKLLACVQYFCVMASMYDPETQFSGTREEVEKFLKVVNVAEAGYFPRYLISVRLLADRGSFKRFKGLIEGANTGIQLTYGSTQQQRYDAILDCLKDKTIADRHLVDIGCGEGWYAVKLAGKYDSYLGVDKDPSLVEKVNKRLQHKQIEGGSAICEELTFDNLDEILLQLRSDGENDVLMTEVLEHMPEDKAEELLKKTLRMEDVDRVIVTVPNKGFNEYYLIEDNETRHHDHHFEPTFEEWCDLCVTLAAETNRRVEVKGIGDSVNGVPTSIMAVFSR